ncbi:hypothetical protein PTKU46_80950 [Paraburkholderia terrae]
MTYWIGTPLGGWHTTVWPRRAPSNAMPAGDSTDTSEVVRLIRIDQRPLMCVSTVDRGAFDGRVHRDDVRWNLGGVDKHGR